MEENKKEKANPKAIFLVSLMVVALMGCFWVMDFIFPKAPKNFQFMGELSNPKVSQGENTSALSQGEFQEILDRLYEAKPTRNQSHNDYPQVADYYKIDFDSHLDGFSGRLYVYESGGQVYFEIPYSGVYQTNHSTLSLLGQ